LLLINGHCFSWFRIAWLLFGFILTSGYSGSLRASLLSPRSDKPVETFAEVIVSGLPWVFPDFGVNITRAEWNSDATLAEIEALMSGRSIIESQNVYPKQV